MESFRKNTKFIIIYNILPEKCCVHRLNFLLLQAKTMSMDMNNAMIQFKSPRLGYGEVVLQNPGLLSLPEGVSVVLGGNGSGKSTLGLIMAKGRYAYGNRLEFARPDMKVRMLTFTDIHSFTGIDVVSHEQRLESTVNDLVPTVAEVVGPMATDPQWLRLCETFALRDVMDKRINYLSSGELRKLLVVNALRSEPDVLILDNPYIGLDAASRSELDAALSSLPGRGVSVVMLLCDAADIPAYADAVLLMADRQLERLITDRDEIASLREAPVSDCDNDATLEIPARDTDAGSDYSVAFAIRDGHVRYGDREIISGLDWTVGRGERWALTGPNGSGKSLLLSMICGDHPQAYANDITLFDRRRGSGESIWEIKDRIGYVCPEMQLYFRSPLPVVGIVAQGLRSALNLYGRIKPEEHDEAMVWLRLLGIEHLAERKFESLSSGEQRMVLLARAFIRQPQLLILDEPLHGLDARSKERVRRIVDSLTAGGRSSLIFVSHYTREIPSSVTFTKTLGGR